MCVYTLLLLFYHINVITFYFTSHDVVIKLSYTFSQWAPNENVQRLKFTFDIKYKHYFHEQFKQFNELPILVWVSELDAAKPEKTISSFYLIVYKTATLYLNIAITIFNKL